MTTSAATKMALVEDADRELVGQCLAGDAKAFGRIVERYQSLVCALAFSACGDVHRSEDIAQESFIIAWRQLRDLREPEKLRSWICGIVRNVANNVLRKDQRTPVAQAEELDEASVASGESPTPADHTISREEEAILMRQLQELPPLYREPMVLYYRQHESVAAVAEALGISEDTAKQRLARGRAMLAERVERSLGTVLRTTAPTAAFTFAVMGVLAATTAQASAATAASATAKAAKGAAAGGVFVAFFLTIIGAFAGMWNMFKGLAENAKSRRERRFVAITLASLLLLCLVAGGMFGLNLVKRHSTSFGVIVSSGIIGFVMSLVACGHSVWIYRKRQQIRTEDGADAGTARSIWHLEPGQPGFRKTVFGMIAAIGFGYNVPFIVPVLFEGVLWMQTTFMAFPILISVLAAWATVRRPKQYRQVIMAQMCVLWLQSAVLCGLLWHKWDQAGLWETRLVVIALQVFALATWTVGILGCWLYWRWERWGERSKA